MEEEKLVIRVLARRRPSVTRLGVILYLGIFRVEKLIKLKRSGSEVIILCSSQLFESGVEDVNLVYSEHSAHFLSGLSNVQCVHQREHLCE